MYSLDTVVIWVDKLLPGVHSLFSTVKSGDLEVPGYQFRGAPRQSPYSGIGLAGDIPTFIAGIKDISANLDTMRAKLLATENFLRRVARIVVVVEDMGKTTGKVATPAAFFEKCAAEELDYLVALRVGDSKPAGSPACRSVSNTGKLLTSNQVTGVADSSADVVVAGSTALHAVLVAFYTKCYEKAATSNRLTTPG
jgi:hypothetical protein